MKWSLRSVLITSTSGNVGGSGDGLADSEADSDAELEYDGLADLD